MKARLPMDNPPEDMKKHCESLLKQGLLPRSGEFNGVQIHLPSWSKYEWKNWAEKHNVELEDDFLDIAK